MLGWEKCQPSANLETTLPMRIVVIGGGPGGLYFSLLTKKARPDWRVEVFEQNGAKDTFGFGVVFSDETLDEFLSHDPPSYGSIRNRMAYWDDIVVRYKGREVRCAGHGFAGCSRVALLRVLQQRCAALGVAMRFNSRIDVQDLQTRFKDADLIVAADGINSAVRECFKAQFRPQTAHCRNKFSWMGSTRPLDAFHYFFRETEHGIVIAHTYQYEPGRSTWVMEMGEACWRGLGLDACTEAASAERIEELFREELEGHPLLINHSLWRNFPRVSCANWHFGKLVLLGDAKASAHYSVGSGTKLAMECAIALSEAVVAHGESSLDDAFNAYEEARRTQVEITQHNADVSLRWFEHVERSWDMQPMQFATTVLARAKSITYDNLALRDPSFIARANAEFLQTHFEETGYDCRKLKPAPMFTPIRLRGMELANRVVVSPMAQYSAVDGVPTDWHFVHYGSRALGGAALMFVEMTCPSPEARITTGCTGLWNDEQERALGRIVDFVHGNGGARICLQLGHAGRKGSTQLGWQEMDHPMPAGNWPLVSASDNPYMEGVSQRPAALTRPQMDIVRDQFAAASERAERAGFDMLELHCAHGYLLASFLSPLTNLRSDAYGGGIDNRMRYPLEVFAAMREVWPSGKPMSVRISACDWKEGGISEADTVAIAKAFAEAGCDLIDVSAGQTVPDQAPVYGRMFQTPFAEAIRNVTNIKTLAVGNITSAEQVNTIIACRRADLAALARPHLTNPYFTHQAAAWYGAQVADWPKQYLPGRDQLYREAEKEREKLRELQIKAKPSSHGVGGRAT